MMDDTFVSCNFKTASDIKERIIKIRKFIDQYRWIMDAYVSDFFVHDFWSRLPSPWTEYLEKLSPPEISFLLRHDVQTYRGVPPLSLLAYRKCVISLAIRRRPVDLDSEDQVQKILTSLEADPGHCEQGFSPHTRAAVPSSGLAERQEWRGVMKNGQWMELEHVYRKHVKPKKQHEIQKLSQVISCVCCQSHSHQVVDVGAGLGHLSRLLTFGHGVKVTTVEASGGHAPKATKFDRETKKDIKKAKLKKQKLDGSATTEINTELQVDLPSHISCRIHPNISTSHFLDLIRQSRRQQQQEEENEQQTVTREYGGHIVKSERHEENHCNGTLADEEHCVKRHCEQIADLVNQKENSLKRTMSQCEKCQNQQKSSITNTFKYSNQNTQRCECKQNDSDNQNERTNSENTEGSYAEDINMCHDEHFVLAGLHACGDLTPTLLRMFVNCEAAVGLASVGCCYMKLSVDGSSDSPDPCKDNGYPMSQFVCGIPDSSLTYSSRELACHFADAYIQRLLDNPGHLKVHGYRAALQHLIISLLPDYKHGALRLTVKNATDKPFESYAKCALQKLGFTSNIPLDLLHEAESYLPLWKNVVVFYVLRLCLAPVVETLLLLDRMLFLHEHGISSVLVPVFDPQLSPRNFALLAMKT